MGLTNLSFTISNPGIPRQREKVDFLIESGAIYSVVSSKILKKLKIKVEEEREFTLADGSKVTRSLGIARFIFGNHIGGAPVIFGKKGDSNLLGVTTLESLGLALNPLKRELMPLPMVLG